MADDLDRVVPLDELDDYEVADGDPDVRGWEVFGADGRRIGEVDELLVDRTALKVRYLDVEIDEELVGSAGGDRHVLIPIGYAQLDEKDDRVRVPALESAELAGLPAYTHQPLTREFESDLQRRFKHDFAPPEHGDFYDAEHFDEDRFFGARRAIRPTEPRVDPGEMRMPLRDDRPL